MVIASGVGARAHLTTVYGSSNALSCHRADVMVRTSMIAVRRNEDRSPGGGSIHSKLIRSLSSTVSMHSLSLHICITMQINRVSSDLRNIGSRPGSENTCVL